METLASAATFVIELFAEVAEVEALSIVRAMLSSPQIFEMLEKLGLFELLPYLNRVFKNKTATRRKRQVAGSSGATQLVRFWRIGQIDMRIRGCERA